jgi:ribosomal protein S20
MISGSLSGVSASSYATSKTEKNPMEADFDDLSKAIESGDLDAAKKVYAKIKEHMENGPDAQKSSGTSETSGTRSQSSSSLKTDFDALGEALESGDLSAAKEALTTVSDNMKAHKPPQKPPSEQTSYETDDTTDWRSLLVDGSTINISA